MAREGGFLGDSEDRALVLRAAHCGTERLSSPGVCRHHPKGLVKQNARPLSAGLARGSSIYSFNKFVGDAATAGVETTLLGPLYQENPGDTWTYVFRHFFKFI